MGDKPVFSVLVPVYKAERFLEKCINSILNQTFQKSYEVILIDDGSPDESGQICDRYACEDPRIKVIHKENGGVARARESGLAIAQGEYVICVDSDDWVHEDMLQRLSQVILEHHPDMVCFGYYTAGKKDVAAHPNRNRLGYYDQKEIEKSIYPRLIQTQRGTYFSSSLCTKAIRRDILIKCYPKDCSIKIGEDWVTSITCTYYVKSIYMLEDCLYYYWYNEDSATKSGRIFDWDDPERQKRYLEQHIDVTRFDFAQQVDRMMVHSLFNTAVSQFNGSDNFFAIACNIKQNLKRPTYKMAITRSRFGGSVQAVVMDWCMKLKCIPLMALYSRVKK